MKYTIISDSCCNLFPKDLNSDKIDFFVAPLTIMLDGREYVDNDGFDTSAFLEKMKSSKAAGKSACPSPEAFAELMRRGDNVIVVAMSSKLSGTYASAMAAAETVKAEFPNKKLCVLDTLSACTGQDHILLKLKEIIEKGNLNFDEVAVKITEFSRRTRVRFLLQDIGNLVKNGRMSALLGRILSTAKIRLVCGEDGKGEIKKFSMALGTRKGLQAMSELPHKDRGGNNDGMITIGHVYNEEGASFVKNILESKFGFKNITMRIMRGISTLYAADKGIVMAYDA